MEESRHSNWGYTGRFLRPAVDLRKTFSRRLQTSVIEEYEGAIGISLPGSVQASPNLFHASLFM
jgi:hypothetical protein